MKSITRFDTKMIYDRNKKHDTTLLNANAKNY